MIAAAAEGGDLLLQATLALTLTLI